MSKFNDLFLDSDLLALDIQKMEYMFNFVNNCDTFEDTLENRRMVKYLTDATYLQVDSNPDMYTYAFEGVIGDMLSAIGRFFVHIGEFIIKSILSVLYPFNSDSSSGGGNGTYTDTNTRTTVNIKDEVNKHAAAIITNNPDLEFPKHILLDDNLDKFNNSIKILAKTITEQHKPIVDIFNLITDSVKQNNITFDVVDKINEYINDRPSIIKPLIDTPDMKYIGLEYDDTTNGIKYISPSNVLPFTTTTVPCGEVKLKTYINTLFSDDVDKSIQNIKTLNTKTLGPVMKDIAKSLINIGKVLQNKASNPTTDQQIKYSNLNIMSKALNKGSSELKALTSTMRACIDTLAAQKRIATVFIKKIAKGSINL